MTLASGYHNEVKSLPLACGRGRRMSCKCRFFLPARRAVALKPRLSRLQSPIWEYSRNGPETFWNSAPDAGHFGMSETDRLSKKPRHRGFFERCGHYKGKLRLAGWRSSVVHLRLCLG